MKRFSVLLFVLLLLATLATAQSTTPNLGLTLPFHGAPNWDTNVNGNFSIVDFSLGCLQNQFQGTWSSAVTYCKGQEVTSGGSLYVSLINGNSNNSPAGSPADWMLMFTVGSSGTVTSVGLTMPSYFSVSGSPVTTSGTIAVTLNSQSQNLVLASPNGSSGLPTFRALVGADIPAINLASSGNGGVTGTLPIGNLPSLTLSNIGAGAAGSGTYDFSAITLGKWRFSAGLSTTTNGDFGYDTTNGNWHFWSNGADTINGVVPVSTTITNGDVVTWSKSGGVITLNDFGAAPLSPSSTATFTNKTFDSAGSGNVFKVNGNQVTAVQGNTATVQLETGATTNGDLASYDASGNIKDSGTAASGLLTSSSTNTFTNKTFDTAGAGNVLKINGTQVSAVHGTSSTVQLGNGGSSTTNDIATFDINGNLQDSGTNVNSVPTTTYLTSNYTNATTGFTNVTGLSFSVAVNTNYKIRCDLDYQVSASTLNVKIQWTGPASPTAVTYDMVAQVTAGTLSSAVATSFSTSLAETGVPTATTNFPLTLTMTLINGANSGTVQLQAAATAAGTVTIIPGSCSMSH